MGNRKQFGSRIDGGEIEFVAKNPKDHPLVYVKAVREACYRRYLRAPGRDKPPLRYSLRLLDQAIARWGEALSAHPHASDCDKQGER